MSKGMVGKGKTGPARKPDDETQRRGVFVQLERGLINRVDQARQATPRTAWIRAAIEQRLTETNED